MIELMRHTGIPNGLAALGYGPSDLDHLVQGAMPQRRLLDNAPLDVTSDDVRRIYEHAFMYWH